MHIVLCPFCFWFYPSFTFKYIYIYIYICSETEVLNGRETRTRERACEAPPLLEQVEQFNQRLF